MVDPAAQQRKPVGFLPIGVGAASVHHGKDLGILPQAFFQQLALMEGQLFFSVGSIHLEAPDTGDGGHQLRQAADQAVVMARPDLLPFSPEPLGANFGRNGQQHVQALLPAKHQYLLEAPEVIFPFLWLPSGP